MNRLRGLLSRAALASSSIVFSVAIGALALELLSRTGVIGSYSARVAVTSPDDRLLVRLKPHVYAEIDARGYRNPAVPESVSVVAIGDSQTYGYNAAWDETWPFVYGALTGRSVYNMGVGSYGPPQYWSLLDEALSLEPETILFGFYLGNDLLDTCNVFRELEYWRGFAAERDLDVRECIEGQPPVAPPATGFDLGAVIRNLEIYRRLKEIPLITALISQRRDVELARTRPDDYFAVSEPDLETVVLLTRRDAMSPQHAPVRRGAELAEYFYRSIVEAAPATDIGVVFIPTKANVLYEELLARGIELPRSYHDLVRIEREQIGRFGRFFAGLGVPTVDSTQQIRSKLALDEPLFQTFADGHPRAPGYRAIGEAASAAFPVPTREP